MQYPLRAVSTGAGDTHDWNGAEGGLPLQSIGPPHEPAVKSVSAYLSHARTRAHRFYKNFEAVNEREMPPEVDPIVTELEDR